VTVYDERRTISHRAKLVLAVSVENCFYVSVVGATGEAGARTASSRWILWSSAKLNAFNNSVPEAVAMMKRALILFIPLPCDFFLRGHVYRDHDQRYGRRFVAQAITDANADATLDTITFPSPMSRPL